ncbi:transposase [Geminicoccus roseus]|uniref:transposase n=1 Tax=Geminicoccus roseus TaxID=404900 RepID=UPI0003FEEA32|nr:transposase [Geminicoccus roseus]
MARPLRLEYPGAFYHVTARGNARAAIVHDDEDRQHWVATLAATVVRRGWRLHAWCLMTNHYHLLVETPEPNLARGMRDLNGIYTQAWNRRHRRVGHVLQGRYKAVLVEKESHFLELVRYVVRNPVGARMVRTPFDWSWSSARVTAGRAERPDWLVIDETLQRFHPAPDKAAKLYAAFVRRVGPYVWRDLVGQIWLGKPEWIAAMQKEIGAASTDPAIPFTQRRPLAPDLSGFTRLPCARNEAIRAAYATGAFSMRRVAAAFDLHESSVSRIVNRPPLQTPKAT